MHLIARRTFLEAACFGTLLASTGNASSQPRVLQSLPAIIEAIKAEPDPGNRHVLGFRMLEAVQTMAADGRLNEVAEATLEDIAALLQDPNVSLVVPHALAAFGGRSARFIPALEVFIGGVEKSETDLLTGPRFAGAMRADLETIRAQAR